MKVELMVWGFGKAVAAVSAGQSLLDDARASAGSAVNVYSIEQLEQHLCTELREHYIW